MGGGVASKTWGGGWPVKHVGGGGGWVASKTWGGGGQ